MTFADRAWSGVDDDKRSALCDLAVQDAVAHAHAANKTVIAGRFETQFRSAFLVRTPCPPPA